jgi:hypothetical protein
VQCNTTGDIELPKLINDVGEHETKRMSQLEDIVGRECSSHSHLCSLLCCSLGGECSCHVHFFSLAICTRNSHNQYVTCDFVSTDQRVCYPAHVVCAPIQRARVCSAVVDDDVSTWRRPRSIYSTRAAQRGKRTRCK